MPNYLLKIQAYVKALTSELKLKISQFPNIFRFITENTFLSSKNLTLLKFSLSGTITVLLLAMTLSQIINLQNNLRQEKKIILERKNIEKEIAFWKKTVEKYNNYSDIYLKIASLEYRLGNSQTARSLIQKALAINPDTQQGRVLGDRISR